MAAGSHRQPRRQRGRQRRTDPGPLPFAFYGRVSTGGYQDDMSSRQWQLDSAHRLVAGHGRIVAEYFDIGKSRSRSWHHRPQAAALLAAAANLDRGFDAIVIGEFERAFCGNQLQQLLPCLQQHDLTLWLPEAHGPIDTANPTHQALLLLLGHQAQRD